MAFFLAWFGLGGLGLGLWIPRYRWAFMAATYVFLGISFYQFRKLSLLNRGILYGTALLSTGLVIYSLFP